MPSVIKVGTRNQDQLAKSLDSINLNHTGTSHDNLPKTELVKGDHFLKGVSILTPVDGIIPEPDIILNQSPKKRIIVGVSGVSCGGKTTIARALTTWLGNYCHVIMQDDYYRPSSELEINPFTNFPEFDEPESVKMHEIVRDIKAWKSQYEEDDDERKVLVIEGTMIFLNPEIAELCDLRYMVHVDFPTAVYRRSLREYPIPDPPKIVEMNIWPKYIKHRELFMNISKNYDLKFKQIDGRVTVEHTIAGILQDLKVNRH